MVRTAQLQFTSHSHTPAALSRPRARRSRPFSASTRRWWCYYYSSARRPTCERSARRSSEKKSLGAPRTPDGPLAPPPGLHALARAQVVGSGLQGLRNRCVLRALLCLRRSSALTARALRRNAAQPVRLRVLRVDGVFSAIFLTAPRAMFMNHVRGRVARTAATPSHTSGGGVSTAG